ncbi:hypothetical protein ILUMI_21640 [Ignelater luminosus]|uniref:Uncharacterized protein n=1 Tax=Ignelater luminosus TaxID=2038154 RepID=A0A8K0CE66_IGNLU|nr:hypothetical protein ILUMI_21640 [Ignelater luminosus]
MFSTTTLDTLQREFSANYGLNEINPKLFAILVVLLSVFREYPIVYGMLILVICMASHLQDLYITYATADWDENLRTIFYDSAYFRPNSKFYITSSLLLTALRNYPILFYILIGSILIMEIPDKIPEVRTEALLEHLKKSKEKVTSRDCKCVEECRCSDTCRCGEKTRGNRSTNTVSTSTRSTSTFTSVSSTSQTSLSSC